MSSHTVGRDRDVVDPDRNVGTYRTKVPRSETVETVRTEDVIVDEDTGRRRIV